MRGADNQPGMYLATVAMVIHLLLCLSTPEELPALLDYIGPPPRV